MGKFDGYLLVSDFDGTLIDDEHLISDRNIAAITGFIAAGGRFLGATGRTELNVRPYTQGIELTLPWILYNGAAIYDWQNEAFIYKAALPRAPSMDFVHKVMARYGDINIQVYPGGPYYQVNHLAPEDHTATREKQHFHACPMEEITDDWLKVLFCSDNPEQINTIERMLEDDPLRPLVHKTRSGQRYFELTAKGVTKGSALERMKDWLTPRPSCVVAIGDYFNDIEMLQTADISAAPATAIAEVIHHASIVTTAHTDSAIADLIRHIERRIDKGIDAAPGTAPA